jgi:hypothetical protein
MATTPASAVQSELGERCPTPAVMRTSAALRLTLYGAACSAIPGPENTSSRKTNATASEPSSGAAMSEPMITPTAR